MKREWRRSPPYLQNEQFIIGFIDRNDNEKLQHWWEIKVIRKLCWIQECCFLFLFFSACDDVDLWSKCAIDIDHKRRKKNEIKKIKFKWIAPRDGKIFHCQSPRKQRRTRNNIKWKTVSVLRPYEIPKANKNANNNNMSRQNYCVSCVRMSPNKCLVWSWRALHIICFLLCVNFWVILSVLSHTHTPHICT